jgi:hypothetical protein
MTLEELRHGVLKWINNENERSGLGDERVEQEIPLTRESIRQQ